MTCEAYTVSSSPEDPGCHSFIVKQLSTTPSWMDSVSGDAHGASTGRALLRCCTTAGPQPPAVLHKAQVAHVYQASQCC